MIITVEIESEITNLSAANNKLPLSTTIVDSLRKVVEKVESNINVKANETVVVTQTAVVTNASHWSVESPVLYTAVS
jgi:beta-galactosidase